MKTISKALTGIAAAAMISVTAAAPADARHRYYYDGDDDVDVGDVVAGAAIVGGVAAIASGLSARSRYNQGYDGYSYPAYPQSGYGYAQPAYPQAYGYAQPAYPQGYAYAQPAYPQGYGYAQPAYPQSGYGYGGERAAVDICAAEAQRRMGAQVRDIDEVDRDGAYYHVRGDVYVRDYDDGRYYDRGEVDSENFICTVSGNRIFDFRVDGRRW